MLLQTKQHQLHHPTRLLPVSSHLCKSESYRKRCRTETQDHSTPHFNRTLMKSKTSSIPILLLSCQHARLLLSCCDPCFILYFHAFQSPPPPPPTATTTSYHKPTPVPSIPSPPPLPSSGQSNIAATGFGSPANTLTEPIWDTVKRDLSRIVSNLKLVVFPNPYREDPGKALRDWDLWGPLFFIVFLVLTLSWSASVKKSEVFAVAFALLASGAVILTLNVLLLGDHIIFFQSISLLGHCLFPLDVGAFICMLKDNVILKVVVVCVALAWSSWAAYPFMSSAVNPKESSCSVSCSTHVCVCWISHHCID